MSFRCSCTLCSAAEKALNRRTDLIFLLHSKEPAFERLAVAAVQSLALLYQLRIIWSPGYDKAVSFNNTYRV